MKYWDINCILRFNRCFNFINGKRSIGKSYGTQKFLINRAIKKNEEFIYITRTQDEKKNGILKSSFEKVIFNEFPNRLIEATNETMYLVEEYEENETSKKILGYCIALTEAIKIKKRSFPNVKYILFDEYMLESGSSTGYVTGWEEPNLFLSIYHTVDREKDKVICFLLGNNTSFFNPYHLHPAFNIKEIKEGEIFKSENVLFQWAKSTEELENEKLNCKFLKMIDNSKYGKYASHGEYIDDNINFIEKRPNDSYHYFSITYLESTYGVWVSKSSGKIYLSEKFDPSCKLNFALTLKDHKENTLLTKSKNNTILNWLIRNYKIGNVKYENMSIKKKTESAISLLL